MSETYEYRRERERLFTEEGQRRFLVIRDETQRLLGVAGAVCSGKLFVGAGDTWLAMAAMDRMIELGEIREVTGPNVRGQERVFVAVRRTA